MKRTAILYTRVSTDEQAEKGFSLRDQKERLERHCLFNGIEIKAHFQDDHTAKNFNRPEFKNLLSYIKLNKGAVNQILFVKWDRFSRNTHQAYNMIDRLFKMGVTPDAIEQHIDFSIPEQHLLLSIYITSGQVENIRRGLNTAAGMRKAKKEGRWCGTPPKGYTFVRDNNISLLTPNKEAPYITEAFEEMARGIFSGEQVFIRMRKKGWKISKSQFYLIMKNPVYAGLIRIPADEREPEQVVQGLHEPLVNRSTFQRVQDIFAGKKAAKASPKTSTIKAELPLRGHLLCPNCGKTMTGSGSTSRSKAKHYYYHCTSDCGTRFRADTANEALTAMFSAYVLNEETRRLLYFVLKEEFKADMASRNMEIGKVNQEIEKIQSRITLAQDRLFDGDIDKDTYISATDRYNAELNQLLNKKVQLELINADTDASIKYSLRLMSNLPKYYNTPDLEVRHRMLGSIFPEKLTFDGKRYRTTKTNSLLSVFGVKTNKLQNRNGTLSECRLTGLPLSDASRTDESGKLLKDIGLLYDLRHLIEIPAEELEFA